mmetsp:Transcript_16667/g.51483  ORF Transcript_16667/g.51483 Transcript_16667/m.51483 type:complete len:309 (-) Transcript_16667:40-966(-)
MRPLVLVACACTLVHGLTATSPSATALAVRGGAGDDAAAAYACETALAAEKAGAVPAVARWRRDVDDGRLCPKGWSDEASSLFSEALKRFDAATRKHWASDNRGAARAKLAAYLAAEVGAAHDDQLAAAADRRLRQLRAALARTHASGKRDDEAELKAVEHAFDGDVARCRVAALELEGAPQRDAFLDAARQLVSDFETSPAAQLLATREARATAARDAKAAKRAAAAASSKGAAPKLVPKSVNFALQLVGMLRPVGFGNMQGFASYAMGPHSLLFGYSDDRDPNGGMEGDEMPLFRLQPKVTVDVDM